MAKKFMFVCVGILALTVAFLLGAQFGRADYVDHSTTGIVAGADAVLLDNGTVWQYDDSGGQWYNVPELTLPVPVSTVKSWISRSFVNDANELWKLVSLGEDAYEWQNCGSPPGGTAIQPATWGSIKAQFGK